MRQVESLKNSELLKSMLHYLYINSKLTLSPLSAGICNSPYIYNKVHQFIQFVRPTQLFLQYFTNSFYWREQWQANNQRMVPKSDVMTVLEVAQLMLAVRFRTT